ncbi:formyl-CoA transferase [Piscinibacter gummiphilus]|uniref:Formyl-CoA transferase n=1 Tax=Piscinibacter gummiphilus TaxID=946333 RepID=A0A1W6LI41_9BURK|nr:formyl-CoA transferase [Piscinibacter gummiphilus]
MPLAGLIVIDLTLARAGPTCVRHLADWGANVIRVQAPDDGSEEVIGRRDGSDYQNLHRNKRVVTLDLKSPEGHAAFLALAREADVVVENMRVKVKHRLKVSYEDVRAVNPRIVYGSISGFGQTGPYADRPGVDQIAQGMSGTMSVTGEPGTPPLRTGIAVADVTAGNTLALAIMMALYARERTGEGAWVHTSLLESQIFMLDFQATRFLVDQVVPRAVGNAHPTAVPTGVFATSDGHVALGASSSAQWKHLCEVTGRTDWAADPQWQTQRGRAKDRARLHAAIGDELLKRDTAHWVEALNAAGIPIGPIYDIGQVFADPQVRHLGMALPVRHPRFGDTHLLGSPINVEGHAKRIRSTAPLTGEHTDSVLSALGYAPEDIAAMRAQRVI